MWVRLSTAPEAEARKAQDKYHAPPSLKVLIQSLPKWHEKTTHILSHKQRFLHWTIMLANRRQSLFSPWPSRNHHQDHVRRRGEKSGRRIEIPRRRISP
ncbi:hypothetical protein C8J56DRAFT_1168162 [Mycena floridula]|nr:hypothetical protein C8J56DRAFT_1168162 [Mycena floridula]